MNQKQVFQEPANKRAVAFFDGQNLYHHARAAFGHRNPNYDPQKLHAAVCRERGWKPSAVRFYTGIPKPEYRPQLHGYWSRKLLTMSRAGVHLTTRKVIRREKGIDVRIALDIVRLARGYQYDIAIIFSQDQDLAEAVEDVREIAQGQGRDIQLFCAFPVGPEASADKGIRGCYPIKIDEKFYNECLDPRDYWR